MAKKTEDKEAATAGNAAFEAAMKAALKKNPGASILFKEEVLDHAREENRISFGNVVLDDISCGGLVRGQTSSLYGPDNCGKSLQAHITTKHVQQVMRGTVVWVPAKLESYDRNLAENVIGVDFTGEYPPIYIVEAEDDETALNIAVDLTRSGAVDLLVIDSYGAMRARAGMAKDVGERRQIGDHANLCGDFLGKWASASIAGGRKTALLALNQQRATLGVDFRGNPLPPHPACAHAVLHADALRIRMSKGKNLPEENPDEVSPVGRIVRYEGEKAKISGPHGRKGLAHVYVKDCEATGNVAGTVDNIAALIEIGKREGLIENAGGSWLVAMGCKVNGARQLAEKLREDKELHDAIYSEIRKTWFHKKEQVA